MLNVAFKIIEAKRCTTSKNKKELMDLNFYVNLKVGTPNYLIIY